MSGLLRLQILCPDREPSEYDVEPGVYTIGSDDDCKIRLAHEGVGGRHAVLTIREDGIGVEDLGFASGTRLDGQRVSSRVNAAMGARLTVGPFVLIVERDEEGAHPSVPGSTEPDAPPVRPSAAMDMDQRRSIKQQIHRELVERLDIKRLSASRINRDELQRKVLDTAHAILKDVAARLPVGMNPGALAKEVYDEAVGLGPLEDLLADPEITEIMVNGHRQVYVEKRGKLMLSEKQFMDDESVLAIIERIVSPLGRRIDESQPYVDARLADGSRVNAVIHPLSLVGPCLTIRKFSKIPFKVSDLIRFGTMTPDIAEFARLCVILRKNIIVSGGTGSGKTTLLNVLSDFLPDDERIVTIEDAAELRLSQAHVVRLESRAPNIEGKGAITIRDLVRNALRMRPDRIVVGECRGGESLDMLQAMNTGHDGSLTTVHANSPRDVISRLETMVLMSGMELPVRAIREQVASAIDLIIHEARLSDGSRKITRVTEVVGLEGDQITMQDIFEFRQTGIDADGHVIGTYRPTGAVPTFLEEIESRGLSVDRRMFDPLRHGGDLP